MSSSFGGNVSISLRLQNVTNELRQIQDVLVSEKELDSRILSDFRDAVNRVRNTAWGLEQYANSKTAETAYQLCKHVQADLANPEIQFQKGRLLHLRDATQELALQLGEVVGK